MNKQKLWNKILNCQTNIKFNDLESIIISFGFIHKNTNGSHKTYMKQGIPEIVNIQNSNGEAKPYQVKQFINVVKEYNLKMEG